MSCDIGDQRKCSPNDTTHCQRNNAITMQSELREKEHAIGLARHRSVLAITLLTDRSLRRTVRLIGVLQSSIWVSLGDTPTFAVTPTRESRTRKRRRYRRQLLATERSGAELRCAPQSVAPCTMQPIIKCRSHPCCRSTSCSAGVR